MSNSKAIKGIEYKQTASFPAFCGRTFGRGRTFGYGEGT